MYDFGEPDGGKDATMSHGPKVMRLGPPDSTTSACDQPGATATVTGAVYDPAGKDPIYNVAVYIPTGPLAPLSRGVGQDACSCSALYPTAAYASTSTSVDGTFVLKGVPVGAQVLVAQIGKWRRRIPIQVGCNVTALPDRTLTLPRTVAAGDTDDNMPDIAVSTGAADTLECLLLRMGVSPAEYVAGASTAGHVHIFAGGTGSLTMTTPPFVQGDGGAGAAELPAFNGAPPSWKGLWVDQAHLMPFDIVLLSCEGWETFKANPPALEQYLNAGGRAFASHFHYSWFSGPLGSGQSYAAPADWGENLGSWQEGSFIVNETTDQAFTEAGAPVNLTLVGGAVDPTLNNGTGKPFAKGATMQTWLGQVGALGHGVPASQLSIYSPRYNVSVGPKNIHSQPWLAADYDAVSQSGATMYFSFDTPVNAPLGDAGTPAYCGRAVYSDLHVGSDPSTMDESPPPSGCDDAELSPQEKALEFMLFDLSSCVTDDALPVPDAGTVVIPTPH